MEISVYSRPPTKIARQIEAKIREIDRVFGKNRASKHPLAHLTIMNHFRLSKRDFSSVCSALEEEFRSIKKPIVKINGWAASPKNHRDIFGFGLKIENRNEIVKVNSRLEKLFPDYRKTYRLRHFNPHISLAWNMKKEMKPIDFKKTLEYLKAQNFRFRKQYLFDKLFVYEKIGKNRYQLVKVIK